MIFIDYVSLYVAIFSPVIASIFVVLIPAYDLSSKRMVSVFFSFVSLIFNARMYFIFLTKGFLPKVILKVPFLATSVYFTLELSNINILFFVAAAFFLFINFAFGSDENKKGDLMYVAPFLLVFSLFVCFGQKEIRLFLPILSITSAIVYYVISQNNRERRGMTIFRMGVFLFSCETIALILLQYPNILTLSPWLSGLSYVAIILPALARLCMPIMTPYMNYLFSNMDKKEDEFPLMFLQLSGYYLLVRIRNEFGIVSTDLMVIINILCLISALFLAVAVSVKRVNKYSQFYGLLFFSTVCVALLYCPAFELGPQLSMALFLTNLICYGCLSTSVSALNSLNLRKFSENSKASMWFLLMVFFLGLPGLGVGAPLWLAMYSLIKVSVVGTSFLLWFIISWLAMIILWNFALIAGIGSAILPATAEGPLWTSWRMMDVPKAKFFSVILLVLVLSLVVPIFVFKTM